MTSDTPRSAPEFAFVSRATLDELQTLPVGLYIVCEMSPEGDTWPVQRHDFDVFNAQFDQHVKGTATLFARVMNPKSQCLPDTNCLAAPLHVRPDGCVIVQQYVMEYP